MIRRSTILCILIHHYDSLPEHMHSLYRHEYIGRKARPYRPTPPEPPHWTLLQIWNVELIRRLSDQPYLFPYHIYICSAESSSSHDLFLSHFPDDLFRSCVFRQTSLLDRFPPRNLSKWARLTPSSLLRVCWFIAKCCSWEDGWCLRCSCCYRTICSGKPSQSNMILFCKSNSIWP